MAAPTAWRQLEAALDENQRIQRCRYQELITALRHRQVARVRDLALQLDRVAGPHIEFEERYVYPIVEDQLGEAYVVQLSEQQQDVLRALVELQAAESAGDVEATRWLAGLRQGLEQLQAAQRLLLYLRELDQWQLLQLLHKWQRLRQIGHRWSELHPLRSEM